jgi:GNAT superfamily N-acetyltransferase
MREDKVKKTSDKDGPSGAAAKLRWYYAEHGFPRTLSWASGKFLRNFLSLLVIFRKFYQIERSLEGGFPVFRSRTDVNCRPGSLKDLEPFREVLKPWGKRYRCFERRLKRGQTCLICLHGEKAVGYIWVSFIREGDRNTGITVCPKDDESYAFDLYVLPEYRQYLVGYELLSRWFQYSREAGRLKCFGVVELKNRPMMITTKLVFGFRVVKRMCSLEFFRRWGIVFGIREMKG